MNDCPPAGAATPLSPTGKPLVASLKAKLVLFAVAFATLCPLILAQPARNLQDFDEIFYVRLAYDLDRYGVFTNGPFNTLDDTRVQPPPGMFFGPVYPLLVAAVMKLDPRFAAAVRCTIEADRGHGDISTCESYDLPIRLLNVLLLSTGAVALAATAVILFNAPALFATTGILAIVALAFESPIFSYVMTESTIFAAYAMWMLATVLAWRCGRPLHYALSGLLLGLLSLIKPSFPILFPVVGLLSLIYLRWFGGAGSSHTMRNLAVFTVAFCCVIGGWVARNAISVGKLGLTEEYGAAVLIERFAYDTMTAREFFQAFPYCTPGIQEWVFDPMYGTDSMHRFTYHTDHSFFNDGRSRRDELTARYGRLDPVISGIIRDEMQANWWRYLLVSIPLAWCGMWVGKASALLFIPLFVWACVRTWRSRQPLLLMYAAPAVVMLALDALVGNHYTRYNLILIGPYTVGAGWIMTLLTASWRWRWRSSAPMS